MSRTPTLSKIVASVPAAARWKLDQEIDFEHRDIRGLVIPKHLGKIADVISDWQGDVADQLGLSAADRNDIVERYRNNLKLQRREVLQRWKSRLGKSATYRALIQVFLQAGKVDCAEFVCDLFKDDTRPLSSSITVEDLRIQHVRIMQLLDLSTILPLIQARAIVPSEDYDKVADTKHHGSIERTGYLLHALYKQGQDAVDQFVQCLHETKEDNPRHSEILRLFEGGLPDLPTRSPIFEILDQSLDDIERLIEFMPFLNILLEAEIIPLSKFMDLQSADRPIKENLGRLFRTLEEKGSRGFIAFMSCLQKEGASSNHQHLFALLYEKAKVFFKSHARRGEISQSDRVELLHMGARDKLKEKRISEKFQEHRGQLEAKLQLSALMPYIQKQHILTSEENERLREIEPARRNHELLEIVEKKGPQFLVTFVDCLEASLENRGLATLFAPPSAKAEVPSHIPATKPPEKFEKHDRLAVIVQAEHYVSLSEEYQLDPVPFTQKVADIRGKLEQNLRQLGFTAILHFKPSTDLDEAEEGQGSQVGAAEVQQGKPKNLKEKFKRDIVERCRDGAIIFIFISAVQFPLIDKPKEKRTSEYLPQGNFMAAILKDGATMTSRRESECIRARELRSWVDLLPNAHVTLLIDTHQSTVARYGMRRVPEVAEIMDDPWGELIGPHSTSVVYYLKPDPTAIARQMGITQEKKEEGEELGMLTECFVSALLNCCKRSDSGLSHRHIYEAVSLYWHHKGRQHLSFVPAIQGDMDREFPEKNVIPYHQFFRADLPKPLHPDKKYDFDLSQLKIPTGSMSGLIRNDQVEVYHILRPSVRAGGRVVSANQLDCTVEVVEEKKKLTETLDAIYQDEELRSIDGSTECLCVMKKYPLHQRFPVFVEGLGMSDAETIRTYVKLKSFLLSPATKKEEAKLLVEPNGNYLLVRDLEKQIKLEARSIDAQHVKIYLEMIAWYKHVLGVLSSPPTKPLGSEQRCFLTAERPLLLSAPPLCDDFQIKYSSYVGAAEDRPCHSAILSYSESMRFWTPASPAVDSHPCLEVEFKKNHVVTRIELRGDAQEEKFVKRADIWYQRDAFLSEVTWPKGSDSGSKTINLSDVEETVRFITIVPQALEGSFSLTFRLKKMLMSGSKKNVGEIEKKVVDVDTLTVINWQYHKQRGTGWKFIPSPNDNGVVSLDAALGWLHWNGSSSDPISFDIGVRGVQLEKIEFTAISGRGNQLQKFLLRMQTDWQKEDKTLSMSSAWPTKHEFDRPLVVSNLQVWPLEASVVPPQAKPGEPPPPSSVKLQMQVYGNKLDEALEVEEGDILSFHFNNCTLRDLHVYIFCFEETGNVKFVTADIAKHPYRTPEKKLVLPAMKKFLQAYIPQGYDSSLFQIRDHYKVLVSARKMYLEPLIQRGLHDYRKICSYNVCSLGRRFDFGPEPWYEHSFNVIVKKSSRK